MLRDLEEMLLTIRNPESREYMRESVKCYHAGAYRAAVILAFAATMDDLRRQIASIAASGAPKPIKDLSDQIQTLFEKQSPYENTLLEQIKAMNDLLRPAEAKKLASVRDTRNSCGHPSGHHGSAEEARDAIATGIDIVLSKPLQFGQTHVTDFLQTELKHPQLFPSNWTDEQCNKVSEQRLNSFGRFVYERLFGELGKIVQDSSADPIARGNAVRFLRGAIRSEISTVRQLVWTHAVAPLVARNLTEQAWPLLIAAKSSGASEAPTTRERIPFVIGAHIGSPLTATIIKTWRSRGYFEKDELLMLLEAATKHYLTRLELVPPDKFTTAAFETEMAESIANAELFRGHVEWPEFTARLNQKLIESAAQYNFHVCNPAIRQIQDFSTDRAYQFSPSEKRLYIYNLARKTSPNSLVIKELSRSGIGPRSDFLSELTASPPTEAELKIISKSWLSIESIFLHAELKTNAIALATNAITAAREWEQLPREGLIESLSRSNIDEIKEACKNAT